MRLWTAGIFALVLVSAGWAAERGPQEMTLTGKLVRAAAIGGETTGWRLELDSDLKIDGRKVKQVEVYSAREKLEPFDGKRVEVKGALGWRQGIERGYYPVVEIRSIREPKPERT